jgi:hypothetical protein
MRFRKLRIAFSVTCLIACVLLIALWVRSYWKVDAIDNVESVHVLDTEANDERSAKSIAIKEVMQRTERSSAESLYANATRDGKIWQVIVNRKPETPGGFWYVEIDSSGKVIHFDYGL